MLQKILISSATIALLSCSASAADLPTKKAPPAFAPPAMAVSWTGFYIGVNGGYAGDQYKYPFSANLGGAAIDGSATITSSGFVGGAQVGYNYQFAPSWVGGLEADIDAASITGQLSLSASSGGTTLSATAGSKTDYLGTVRARLGYLVTDRLLAFGTGGFAYGDVKSSVNASLTGLGSFGASKTSDIDGWTLGAGVEYMINKNWTFKTEYLYVDLGDATLLSGSGRGFSYNLKVHTTDNIVRAGLNYKFD